MSLIPELQASRLLRTSSCFLNSKTWRQILRSENAVSRYLLKIITIYYSLSDKGPSEKYHALGSSNQKPMDISAYCALMRKDLLLCQIVLEFIKFRHDILFGPQFWVRSLSTKYLVEYHVATVGDLVLLKQYRSCMCANMSNSKGPRVIWHSHFS